MATTADEKRIVLRVEPTLKKRIEAEVKKVRPATSQNSFVLHMLELGLEQWRQRQALIDQGKPTLEYHIVASEEAQ